MVSFINDHLDNYGVEPICKVLPITPSTYYERLRQRQEPKRPSARAWRDEVLVEGIRRVYEANRSLYGVRKVWRRLLREGVDVARCTVERMMSTEGLRGVVPGKVRTTISDAQVNRPDDLVQRQFRADAPNKPRVADFTHVRTLAGMVYIAFNHRYLFPPYCRLAKSYEPAYRPRAGSPGAGAF